MQNSPPYGFKEFFEENALPLPPIPNALVDSLAEIDVDKFSTYKKMIYFPPVAIKLDSIDTLLPSSFGLDQENTEEVKGFCALGLGGYGVENRFFYYLEDYNNIKCIIRMPWGKVYGNEAKDRENLDKVMTILKIAKLCDLEKYQLQLVFDNSSCEWLLRKKTMLNDEIVFEDFKKSDSFKELLQIIEGNEIIEIKGHEHTNWLSV